MGLDEEGTENRLRGGGAGWRRRFVKPDQPIWRQGGMRSRDGRLYGANHRHLLRNRGLIALRQPARHFAARTLGGRCRCPIRDARFHVHHRTTWRAATCVQASRNAM